jgi:Xaa-Pro aminopeptidase
MEKVYSAVLAAEQAAIAALVPGTPLRSVYAAAQAALAGSAPELADKLGKNVGFAMHLELRESKLQV